MDVKQRYDALALKQSRCNGRPVVQTAWFVVWECAMAYTDFTLDMLIEQFGLQIQEDSAFLAGFAPLPISPLLRQELAENVPLARDISTEKARAEFIIAPVLVEVRRQCQRRISLFSGVEFTVDSAQGLRGVCDFLLSLSPLQLTMQAPVVAVVEAKNENMKYRTVHGGDVGSAEVQYLKWTCASRRIWCGHHGHPLAIPALARHDSGGRWH